MDRLDEKLIYLHASDLLRLEFPTYNELVSNGKFEMRRNREIRESIANYYEISTMVSNLEKELREAELDLSAFLVSQQIPKAERMLDSTIEQLITDKGEYKIVLKKLIYTHLMSRGMEYQLVRTTARKTLESIQAYQKKR